jgi:type IV secretory pathway VirJ component
MSKDIEALRQEIEAKDQTIAALEAAIEDQSKQIEALKKIAPSSIQVVETTKKIDELSFVVKDTRIVSKVFRYIDETGSKIELSALDEKGLKKLYESNPNLFNVIKL